LANLLTCEDIFAIIQTSLMIRLLIKIIINGIGFFLIANYLLLANLNPYTDWKKLALAGLVLGIANYLIR
jgi:hypothetical protein